MLFKAGIIIISLLVISFIGYFVYSQKQIKNLSASAAIAQQAAETNAATIDSLIESQLKQEAQLKTLRTSREISKAEVDRIAQLLRKNDLNKVSVENPSVIENVANIETKKLFNDLIQEFGVPISENTDNNTDK